MSVLKIKDNTNTWTGIYSIRGEKGENGTGFLVEKTYLSQALLESDTEPVSDGKIVAVTPSVGTKLYIRSTGVVENPETGDLNNYKFFANMEDITVLKGDTGLQGERGFSPSVTENPNNTNNIYKLDIENEDGVFTTPNLKGQSGDGSGDMVKSIYDPNNKGYDIYSHDIKDDVVTFLQATTRENISSGDAVDIIMGKISKVINDLSTIAYSSNPSDLSTNVPINKGGTGASDAATARSNLGIVNLTFISNTAPTDTTSLWLDTSLAKPALKYYNGSTWVKVTSDGGIYRGTTQPTDTDVLWIDTSTGIMKYHNGSSWVNVASTWG